MDHHVRVLSVMANAARRVVVVAVLALVGLSCRRATRAPAPTSSGLVIEEIRVGDGAVATKGQIVSVHYTGRLTDGEEFDSSRERGLPFDFALGLGKVIAGWDQGIGGMRVGGKRRLTIPPDLGYGAEGAGRIPPNATLVFDVELVGVRPR
jgi:FKBP-type peptidyl-prolyl cis-trans isomerase